jgi:hypothetical protein
MKTFDSAAKALSRYAISPNFRTYIPPCIWPPTKEELAQEEAQREKQLRETSEKIAMNSKYSPLAFNGPMFEPSDSPLGKLAANYGLRVKLYEELGACGAYMFHWPDNRPPIRLDVHADSLTMLRRRLDVKVEQCLQRRDRNKRKAARRARKHGKKERPCDADKLVRGVLTEQVFGSGG